MFKDGLFSDFKIKVKSSTGISIAIIGYLIYAEPIVEYNAHKVVLASRSPHFKTLFQKDIKLIFQISYDPIYFHIRNYPY